jgi:hypothetical protein
MQTPCFELGTLGVPVTPEDGVHPPFDQTRDEVVPDPFHLDVVERQPASRQKALQKTVPERKGREWRWFFPSGRRCCGSSTYPARSSPSSAAKSGCPGRRSALLFLCQHELWLMRDPDVIGPVDHLLDGTAWGCRSESDDPEVGVFEVAEPFGHQNSRGLGPVQSIERYVQFPRLLKAFRMLVCRRSPAPAPNQENSRDPRRHDPITNPHY